MTDEEIAEATIERLKKSLAALVLAVGVEHGTRRAEELVGLATLYRGRRVTSGGKDVRTDPLEQWAADLAKRYA